MRILASLASLALLFAAVVFADDPDPEPNAFISGWDKAVDPDKDCKFVLARGGLSLTVPGKPHDLGIERKQMNAPRLLRDVQGDFVVQVRVGGEFAPSEKSAINERLPFVGAGLVLMVGEDTYVRLERASLRINGKVQTYANWELRSEGKWVMGGNMEACPLKEKSSYLRLQRKGDKLVASASEDGKKWTELKPLELKLPAKVKVGVAACTSSTASFSPHYDRFHLSRGKRD